MTSLTRRSSGLRRSLAALFFASGAASLGFEVVWAKQLSRVLGGSTSSIAFVVALFMGGMGLGYAVGGRVAHRLRRPVAAYGIAELVLAGWALVVVHVVPHLEGVFSLGVTYAVCVPLLLPCTFLAGVTLPLLVEGTRGSLGGALGTLYGLNTGGAVVGVLITGFVLVGMFGLTTSAWLLSGLGAATGLIAILISEPRELGVIPARPRAATGGFWILVAAVIGASSLAEEVLWTRALMMHFNSSTYALSAILAVFLTGIALGAGGASAVLRRGARPGLWLLTTQIAAGTWVLFTPEFFWVAERVLPGYVGVAQVSSASQWLGTVGLGLGRAAFVLLVPTVLLGFGLPLVAEIYAGTAEFPRSIAVGRVSASNAIGAVVGSLAARFVLLPQLGIGEALRVTAVLHALVGFGVVLMLRDSLPQSVRRSLWIAFPAALVIASIFRAPAEPSIGRLAEGHEMVFLDEGVQDTTVIVDILGGIRQIFSNGVAYAGDQPQAKRYMRLLGHLPSLRARQQERALVVCLGTGMTAAAVARHPWDDIDLVDISPVVHRTLPFFAEVNDQVYDDPRVDIRIEDGRVFMARAAPGTYDVITLEPPPPRATGVAALYSVEFYQSAERLLADGGAIAQWLPLHGMTRRELHMLSRSFFRVFPDGELIELLPNEAALLAVKGEGASAEVAAERAARPSVREHLSGIGVDDPAGLPTVSGPRLRALFADADVVTDDDPKIENFAFNLDERDATNTEAATSFLREVFER